MSAVEVRDRLADRFRLLQGSAPGPERQLTLRHAVEWSYDLLTDDERSLLRVASVFAGGFDLASIVRGRRTTPTRSTCCGTSTRSSASRSSSPITPRPRTRYRLFETIRQFAEDRLAESGELERTRDRHAAHFAAPGGERVGPLERAGWRDAVDWVELELGNLRSAFRWSADRRRRRGGDRHRRPRRADGLLGAAVRDARVGRGAPRGGVSGRRVPRLPRLYTAAGYACFAGRPDAARQQRPPGHRARGRRTATTRASPATRCSSKRSARCTAATSIATSSSPARSPTRTEPSAATAWRRTSTVSSRRAASRRHSRSRRQSVAAARDLGNPYWIVVRAVDRRHGVLAQPTARRALAAWDEGVAFVREHRVHFFEGFLARDAARLHTSDGEPEAALILFAEAIDGVPPCRQRPAARHHARQRAGVVRAARALRAGGDAARRDVAAAVELRTTCPSSPTSERRRHAALGAARRAELDRDRRGVRPRRRRGVRPAADRRSPGATRRRGRVRRARVASAGGRSRCSASWPPVARRARSRPSCSSRRGPPSTTSPTSTRRSASRTAPRRRAGRSRNGVADA